MKKKTRRDWKLRVWSTILRQEEDMGAGGYPEPKEEWERLLALRLLQAGFPAVQLSTYEDFRNPRLLGALLGHKKAFYRTAAELFAIAKDRVKEKGLSYSSRLWLSYWRIEEQSFHHYLQIGFWSDLRLHELTIRRCMAIATNQAGDELAEFSEGFANGVKKGTINRSFRFVAESDATPIYKFLWAWGKLCKERLNSLSELHELLRHLLGSQVMGDLGRLKKICERVKFRIAKRGRGKKKRDIREIRLSLFREFYQAKARLDENIIRQQTVHAQAGLLQTRSR